MPEVFLPLVAASLLGALLALDQTAWGQLLLSRPLPAGLLVGLALGAPATGGALGLLLELLWIRALPIGSSVPYLPLYPAVLSVLLATSPLGRGYGWDLLPFALLLALPSVAVNHRVDMLWRKTNDFLGEAATSFVGVGRPRGAQGMHLLSLARLFLLHAAALSVCGLVLLGVFALALPGLPHLVSLSAVLWPVPFLVGLAGALPRGRALPRWSWGAAGAALALGALAGSGGLP